MSRRVLACCSGGGHLKQLVRFVELIPEVDRIDWLTHDTALGRKLYEERTRQGEGVYFAPHPAPRDALTLLKDAGVAWRLLSQFDYDIAVSTGGTVALAVLPLARLRRIKTYYIESATRSEAPSTTGKVLRAIPGIGLFTQHSKYATRRWQYIGCVFDEYAPGPPKHAVQPRRILVTVGTLEAHTFRRLVDRVLAIADPDWEITWQVGPTRVDDLDLPNVHRSLPADEMERLVASADVVIAHAGTGTALTAFEHGVCPVLVARTQASGEHVDDHQRATTAELARRGLAIGVEVDDLTAATLLEAARRSVRPRPGLRPLPI